MVSEYRLLDLTRSWMTGKLDDREADLINAKKEERERILSLKPPMLSDEAIEELEECFRLAPHDDECLRILVRDSLDYFKTGKRSKERQDESRKAYPSP